MACLHLALPSLSFLSYPVSSLAWLRIPGGRYAAGISAQGWVDVGKSWNQALVPQTWSLFTTADSRHYPTVSDSDLEEWVPEMCICNKLPKEF